MKGDGLLIYSPTVLGFSLGIKLWGKRFIFPRRKSRLANVFNVAEFAVHDIRDIEWQSEAFTHLQIPPKKKKAIQALTEAHLRRASTNSFAFDDFVVGKGLGFNMLLWCDV